MPSPAVPPDAPILTAAAMRAEELRAATTGRSLADLMDLAGRAVADCAWRIAAGRPILILCGPGNNGGDGYVAARVLGERGATVRVAATGAPGTDLAHAARAAWGGPVEPLGKADARGAVLVDAVFGVGMSRPLAPELAVALARLAEQAARVLAVDLPSGIDSDSGELRGVLHRADVTLALGALKPAHVLLPGAARCGVVRLEPLAMRPASAIRTMAHSVPAAPGPSDHKYRRGTVAVGAGSMPGAAQLAARAALRAGAGYVTLCGGVRGDVAALVLAEADAWPALVDDRRVGAVVAGCGADAGDLPRLLDPLWDSGVARVLDAGAVALAAARRAQAPTVLTPHEGEFARAFPDLRGSKIDRTRAAARMTGAVVVHKGADTVIAAPDGAVTAGWPGDARLATAGSGDVLAGAIGAMLSRGLPPLAAAEAGVAWHVATARGLPDGFIADDLVRSGT